MTAPTAFVTHSACSRHDPGWKHLEHQGRLPAVARAVHGDMLTLFDHLLEVEGVPASIAELRNAHAEDYVRSVRERCQAALEAGQPLPLEGDVNVSGASWEATLAAVGCVLTAVECVQRGEARNAFCAVRPPGHGAGPDSAGAFGIFNAVAIAALRLTRAGAGEVLVVEWGSRPGFGTARILEGERGVRFVSLHREGEEAWPVAASGVISRPLASRSGLDAVMPALRSALDQAEREFEPEFILLSLGCDALSGDPLGDLALNPSDYHDLTTEVRVRAERLCEGRLVSVLEEGYETGGMGQAVVQHLRALAALPPDRP